jgi:hypothetical protein
MLPHECIVQNPELRFSNSFRAMEDSDIVGHPEVADLVIGPPQRDSADLNEVDRTTQVKDEGDDDNDR